MTATPGDRPALYRLAEDLGIERLRRERADRVQVVPDPTLEVLCAAMGFDASTERAAERSLSARADAQRARWLDDCVVAIAGSDETSTVLVDPTALGTDTIDWSARMCAESGEVLESSGSTTRPETGPLAIALPVTPDIGVHTIEIALTSGARHLRGVQRRIVAPARCQPLDAALARDGAFGLCANLYSVRGANGFGFGDFGDLRTLVEHARASGAAFIGLNPLHALGHGLRAASPYSPRSRLYRSMLYLDIAAIPELAASPAAQRALAELGLPTLRAASHLDYAGVELAKIAVLRHLYATFCGAPDTSARRVAFATYCEREGGELDRFATFQLLEELERDRAGSDWRSWPADLQRPDTARVRELCRAHADVYDFHRFVQFELDRQLATIARELPLALGLYTDLAVGSPPESADVWAHPDLVAKDVHVGAPPDAFAREGQDWCLAPLLPEALARAGFRFYERLLRASFAHAGALRIDHVMGLERLFWIPAGRPASEGAYVRYPARELFGVLALESHRAGAVVIGEDLGTLPEGFDARLANRGVFSSRVLLFEHEPDGAMRPPERYSPRALVTANTHDLAPLSALLSDRDLEVRRAAGGFTDETYARALTEREELRVALLDQLRRLGLLEPPLAHPSSAEDPDPAAWAAAITALLCSTPAPLVGLSLDDLAGEEIPINLPGLSQDQHPSWTRRMQIDIEHLFETPTARQILAAIPPARRSATPRSPKDSSA